MLKVMSSIIRRVYGARSHHNQVRRSNLRLPLTVSLLDPKTKAPVSQNSPALRGYLRDINKKGLSLVMPSVHFGDPYLMCGGYTLLITIEFPNRAVKIQAAPARFDRLDESEREYSYLIGARILQMSKSDRRYLANYIKSGGGMPEVMGSIVRRLHDSLVNHVHVRQSGMRLPLTVSLFDSETKMGVAQYTPAMPGYLHDISKTGLSLIVPSVPLGSRYPIGVNYTLRIMVELPNGVVNIQATPVRYDRFEENRGERRHLIGARILQMTKSDRRRLIQHVQQVKKSKTITSETSFAHDAKLF
jgi:hypothetical protein